MLSMLDETLKYTFGLSTGLEYSPGLNAKSAAADLAFNPGLYSNPVLSPKVYLRVSSNMDNILLIFSGSGFLSVLIPERFLRVPWPWNS